MYSTLEEIKDRLTQFIPNHPLITIEFYNKKFGLWHRRMLSDMLEPDLESIYVYLRSKKPMICHVCEARNADSSGSSGTDDNHDHL
jgi:hypothetical protein